MAPLSRRPAGQRRKPRRPLAARLGESVTEGATTVVAAAAGHPRGALLACGAVVVAGAAGGAALALAGGGDPASLTAHYSGTGTWAGGFAGRYVIRNAGESAVSDWKLTFTLPEGATISSMSNARYTVAARQVTAVPYGTGADLSPGRSVTVALTARSPSGARITRCSINGTPCTIGAIPAQSRRPTASPSPRKHPTRKPSARPTPTPTHSAARPKPKPVPFAPYVDTSLAPAFDLVGAARTTGVKTYTLAFIKPDGGCTPKWGGSTLDGDPVAAKIGALRAVGGDVRVSFGGQSGNELARACSSVSQLASAYAQVIDHYKLTKADFDVEGDALADDAANDRRNRALAALQKSHPGLEVSFTLPALPRGLTSGGLSLLRNAKSHGVDIGAVNAMAMDYGSYPAPHPDGKMGDYAIDAAQAAHTQLKGILGGSDAAVWSRIAVTPMVGVNDVQEEVFTVADAAKVGAFAKSRGMAWVSMWSAARDKACSDGPGGPASATCSGVGQSANAFTKAFASQLG